MRKLLFALMMIQGLAVAVLSATIYQKELELQKTGVVTKGRIERFESIEDDSSVNDRRLTQTTSRYPWVVFTTAAGKEMRFRGASNENLQYKVDQEVDVIYPQNEPERAQINVYLLAGPVFGMFAGLLWAAIFAYALFRRRPVSVLPPVRLG